MIPGAVEIFLMLFADDVILLSSTVVGLQNQLNVLKHEADRLFLKVNLDKTNVMVFRKGGHLSRHEKWHYGTDEINVTNRYKYLGVLFTTKLSMKSTVEEVCRKGKKGIIEILRCLRRLGSIDSSIFWKLFGAQIEPMVTYGAEICFFSDYKDLEKVHTFAIKRFLNVPLHASNTVVYGETGRHPLYIKTYVKCIKYWLRLIKLPSSRLCKQAYEMLLNEQEKGKENWAYLVKQLLTIHGFGIVWMCQGVGCEYGFVSEFKDRLISSYKQDWHSEMENNEKYNWFYRFNSVFEKEKYIIEVTNKWHRISLARFRLRTLGLNAHKQWFQTDPSTCSPCPMCGFLTEDEIHFLFHCKAYAQIREKCVVFKSNSAKNEDIFGVLKMNHQISALQSLAKFIAEALNLRRKKE
eukprot:TRINITY_DN9210_c0_g1_i1.p1 TRINITY_DN9210_c0_g1~~TRINITY_DN9210_c0_g1_i1.p1  ORF type:complete len:408 (+),score=9.52 TRINITY_DN9210_c0_g1_i1:2081-3304(+)